MPEFSIIIPTFQKKRFLQNTLLALNYQETADFEVLVIDYGSDDGTGEMIAALGQLKYTLKYFYLTRNETSCAAKTRNYGLQKSEGEIIVFLDDDIIVAPDFLREQKRYHQKAANILVLGGRYNLNYIPSENDLADQTKFKRLLVRVAAYSKLPKCVIMFFGIVHIILPVYRTLGCLYFLVTCRLGKLCLSKSAGSMNGISNGVLRILILGTGFTKKESNCYITISWKPFINFTGAPGQNLRKSKTRRKIWSIFSVNFSS